MRKIGVIYSGIASHYRTFKESKYREYVSEYFYFPDFEHASLSDVDVLIVPSQLNENLLKQAKSKIQQFTEDGGIVVAFGPQPWEWIPNQDWEERETNFWWWLEENPKSGLHLQQPEHDLFTYISLEDATWHQHGVFWPSQEADKLITTEDGGAVLYIDKTSTKGTWIVTTLDPDYHFGSYFMPATERFLNGFFPWLTHGKI